MSKLLKWISDRPWVNVSFSQREDSNSIAINVDSRFISPGENDIITRHVSSKIIDIKSITDDKLIEYLNDLYVESISFTNDK